MKQIQLLSLLFISIFSVSAQDIDGTWVGKMLLPNKTNLNIVFHIHLSNKGYIATMDSPDQSVKDIIIDSINFNNNSLFLKINRLAIVYKGVLENDSILKGSIIQGMLPIQLDLTKREYKPNRPQEPKKPYPYISEDVEFYNDSDKIRFAGTLTYPQKGSKFPAVVLITGSGPQNRDEELFVHKPFLVISDYLTRNGIAVLRYDDRGTARSEGDFNSSTTKDFALDALSAFKYLKSRKFIDSKKVGLLGHSEGGTIAFMLSAENKDIAYVISLAGTSYKGVDVLRDQRKMFSKALGVDSITFAHNEILIEKMNQFVSNKNFKDIKQNALQYVDSLFSSETLINNKDIYAQQLILSASPWMRYMLEYDPGKDIAKIKSPILALNGAKDLQVNADINLNLIKKLAPNSMIKKYPDLNHLFQHCETGLINEYNQIEETISPEVLEDISSWIKEVTSN